MELIQMIIITAYTRCCRLYIYILTAIASRQPRSSVPAAIYIVFIALRAVSIHFYHCFTVYTFPILYTIIISSPVLPIQLAAVRPNVYFGLEVNIYGRPDEYIRYIIIISPPSTCTNTRVYILRTPEYCSHIRRSPSSSGHSFD